MSETIGLLLLTVLCASVGGVQGECRHVQNDDMIEYSCVGGQLSDLDSLPVSTGKLRITSMPISRITANTFSRFGSELWVLGCSHCGVVDIEPGAFQHLSNLQQLSLDNNRLNTVRESWFRGLDYLTYLDLNYNNVEYIEDGVYKNLPSLVDLRLSGNRLECLDLEAMSHLKDLKRMFLTENAEFKCPNAVSTFLEEHGVSFERDAEWNKLPYDLVAAEGSFEYEEYEDTTSVSATPLPTYRERLHLTSPTPLPPVEPTAPYLNPSFHTTEDVVYRPVHVTPDWRTTPRSSTPPYDDRDQATSRPYYDDRRTYAPPRTIAPIESMPPETPQSSWDETTLRSWQRFPESTSVRPGFPLYPPHETEDRHDEETHDSSEATNPFPLAPVPSNETPSFVESEVERTTVPYRVDWSERSTISIDPRFPSVDDERPPEYRLEPVDGSPSTQAVQPLQPALPDMMQPATPDNVYQPPHYVHPITVHSPPLGSNQPGLEEGTPGVTLIETTTDKPLPNCSHKNMSPLAERSIGMLVLSALLVFMGNVLLEGF